MKIRMISAHILALVVGLATLAPAPAFGQTGNILLTTDVVIGVPATNEQIVRVTFANPNRPDPAVDLPAQTYIVSVTDLVIDPVTIGPGESFTYTLDPSEVGVLVDTRTGLRHVRVSARITAIAIDPSDPSAPNPALLVELLNRRTGKLESFHAVPGFSGGVFVASGD